MLTARPATPAKGEDRGTAVFMTVWSVGSADFPHLVGTIDGNRKALTAESLMKGNHSNWFAFNYILWLKQVRRNNDAYDQQWNQYTSTGGNEELPRVFRSSHCA